MSGKSGHSDALCPPDTPGNSKHRIALFPFPGISRVSASKTQNGTNPHDTQDVLAGVSVETKTLICTALRDVLEGAASHRNYSGDLPAHKACTHLRAKLFEGRSMARIRHSRPDSGLGFRGRLFLKGLRLFSYLSDLPAHKACAHLRPQFIQGRCRAILARVRQILALACR